MSDKFNFNVASNKCVCGKQKNNLNEVNWLRHLKACVKINEKKRSGDIKSFFISSSKSTPCESKVKINSSSKYLFKLIFKIKIKILN